MNERLIFSVVEPRKDDDAKSCRRRFGRRLQESLHCDIGIVVDLSAGGMRVVTGRVPSAKKEIEVCLISSEGEITVKARVAWKKRKGFSRHEVGLEFIDVDEQTKRLLTAVSSAHRAMTQKAA